MNKILFVITAVLLMICTACSIRPQPIAYGSDACHYCSMTIVDRQHAAQIVTKKGKAFKFDASECMLNHLKEVDNDEIALFLVNDYGDPGVLTDATKATYLISKGIPSPMGEFLSAFSKNEEAEKVKYEHDGELFTWPGIQNHFVKKLTAR